MMMNDNAHDGDGNDDNERNDDPRPLGYPGTSIALQRGNTTWTVTSNIMLPVIHQRFRL